MRHRRVFHIVTHFDLGGAEKVAANIASSPNPGFEYHLVEVVRGVGPFANDYIKSAKSLGIILHRSHIRNKKLGIILFPFWFMLSFLRYKPSIIHSHTEIPDVSVFLFHKLCGWMFPGTKYFRTIHNTLLWDRWGKIGKHVEPFYISHHSNIAISIAVREEYNRIWHESPPVVYNGVSEVQQRAFPGIDRTRTNLLFAGRLEPQKGVDVLISVIKKSQGNHDLAFWIVGSGSLYNKMREELKDAKNVFYYESIFELSSYLASFDYLFMPSHFEGLGLLSIEASLAKTPAIINDCIGLNETLPNNWPLKVQGNDINQYLEIILHLDSHNRDELGLDAYRFVNKKFSVENMQNAYETLYSK